MNKNRKTAVNQTILGLVFFNVALINIVIAQTERLTAFSIPSPFSNIYSALMTVSILYFFNYIFYGKENNYKPLIEYYESKKESKFTYVIRTSLSILVVAVTLFSYIFYFRIFN